MLAVAAEKLPVAAFLDKVRWYVWRWAGRLAAQFPSVEREDWAQEIMTELVRSYATFDPARGAPTTWVDHRVRHVRWVWLRKRKAARRVPLDVTIEPLHAPAGRPLSVADPRAADPAEAAAHREELARVAAAVRRLHKREREVLARRFGLEGGEAESQVKVGRRLGVSKQAVQAVEADALERLADELLEW